MKTMNLANKITIVRMLLIMLVALHMVSGWIAILIIGRELVVTAIRSVASAQGIALAADRLGKLKMAFQVIAIAVGLTVYSGLNYLVANYRKLQLHAN